MRELEKRRESGEGRLGQVGVQVHDADGRVEPVVGERGVEQRGEERREGEKESAEL